MTSSTTTVEVPESIGASMSLPVDGGVAVHDGLNTHSGRFTTTADALDIGPTISTLVADGGGDPIWTAIIGALGVLTGSTGTPVHCSVSHVDDGTLLVQVDGTTLWFIDAGAAPATDPRVLRDLP